MAESTIPVAQSSLGSRLAMIALGAVMLFGVFVYSTAQFGLVQGEEFSPYSFKRRSFTYYEIPVFGIQVSPIQHDDTTGDLEVYLVGQKLVLPTQLTQDRWDLVRATGGRTVSNVGDAAILYNYLVAGQSGSDSFWLAWTKKHPEAAKCLWPAITKLAEQELYVLVPDLISAVRNHDDVQQLKEQIESTLGTNYLRFAEIQQELERHEQAIELFTEALQHAPREVQILEGRAKSYSRTNKPELAAKDEAAAAQLKAGGQPE